MGVVKSDSDDIFLIGKSNLFDFDCKLSGVKDYVEVF